MKRKKDITIDNEQNENERKKEYLKRYQGKVQAAKDIENEIEELRIEKMYPSAKLGDGMPHAHNHIDLSDYMEVLECKEQLLIKARYEKVRAYTEIFIRIEKMENEREKRILRLKYIKGLSWEKVCEETGYSWRQVHYIHSSALNNFII